MAAGDFRNFEEASFGTTQLGQLPFPLPVLAGSTLCVMVRRAASASSPETVTVTDSLNGDAYINPLQIESNENAHWTIWHCQNSLAGANTVEVTFQLGRNMIVLIGEYEGIDTIQPGSINTGTVLAGATSGFAPATTVPTSVLWSGHSLSSGTTITPLNGEIERGNHNDRYYWYDRAVSVVGSYEASWNFSGTRHYYAHILPLGFGGAPPGTALPQMMHTHHV